jgi:hypothetical protein
MITFTPDNGMTDGFFIARMRRIPSPAGKVRSPATPTM